MDEALRGQWRRSTYCAGGACLEVDRDTDRDSSTGAVAVRDSTAPGVVLRFSAGAFRDFVEQVKRA